MKFLWSQITRVIDRIAVASSDPLLLCIRLYWGWQFFLTGKGKLGNLEATSQFFGELGLPLPKLNAVMAGSTECVGGLLLLLGFMTRPICLPLIFTMVVAYLTAHLEELKGVWENPDGFVTAAPFLFLLASVINFTFGPGRWSVDHFLVKRNS